MTHHISYLQPSPMNAILVMLSGEASQFSYPLLKCAKLAMLNAAYPRPPLVQRLRPLGEQLVKALPVGLDAALDQFAVLGQDADLT